MRGIVSVTLTSILSHRGRGGQGRCFEMVSKQFPQAAAPETGAAHRPETVSQLDETGSAEALEPTGDMILPGPRAAGAPAD